MKDNPYNEMTDEAFLDYLAQNDYTIDGKYLPEGVRLFGVRDNVKSLQIRYDELWEQHKRLAQMCKEAEERVEELELDKFRGGGLWEKLK